MAESLEVFTVQCVVSDYVASIEGDKQGKGSSLRCDDSVVQLRCTESLLPSNRRSMHACRTSIKGAVAGNEILGGQRSDGRRRSERVIGANRSSYTGLHAAGFLEQAFQVASCQRNSRLPRTARTILALLLSAGRRVQIASETSILTSTADV